MKTKTRAFTFIEIIIALSIIATLSAILLSVFFHQLQKSYVTTCQSNLKQVYLGFQMYLQDHDGNYPHLTSWPKDVAPYLKNSDVLLCPSLSEQADGTTYGFINERLNAFHRNKNGAISWTGVSEGSIPSTSNVFMLMDGVGITSSGLRIGTGKRLLYSSSCSIRNPGQLPTVARDFPTYHLNGGNYLFADGHVKWLLPENALAVDCVVEK